MPESSNRNEKTFSRGVPREIHSHIRLALGHWHNKKDKGGNNIVAYSGTQEIDEFGRGEGTHTGYEKLI